MLPEFELCCAEFGKYGFDLERSQYDKLNIYSEFLVEYNKNVNLTAISDPKEILVKHFIDSVIVLKYADFPDNSSLIDVGTGAGFPSVPMKIFRPDLNITLLDSLDKRITFLKLLCERLEIDADFIHGRAENVSKMPEYREMFDFSCARAVANLSTLAEYCIPFVKVGGSFISLKGPSEDIALANNSIGLLGGKIAEIKEYQINDETRRLVRINKISQTPSKYPRNSAQIKKKPL